MTGCKILLLLLLLTVECYGGMYGSKKPVIKTMLLPVPKYIPVPARQPRRLIILPEDPSNNFIMDLLPLLFRK